jgi:HSP20 family protein
MNISDLVPWQNRNRVRVQRNDEPGTRPLGPWQRDMDLFDDFFRGFEMTPFGQDRWAGFSPKVDVTENEKEICVMAELPGIDENEVDVTLNRDSLTIKGEKRAEKEDKGDNYYRMERSYGSFQRTIPLPAELIDGDQVDATFKNGVLTVTLPKRPETRQSFKRIAVKKSS